MNFSDLHRQAAQRLSQATYSPRRLVLIHTAISLGASLALGLINLLFSYLIADTGGLSGLGTRSILQTAQATLELAVTVALPFWNIGLTFAALGWARGQNPQFPSLLEGFQRFRSVLGIKLLAFGIFMAIGMAVSYIGTMLFMLTPFANPLMTVLEPILQDAGYFSPDLFLTDEAMAQIGTAAIPLMIFLGVVFALVAIPAWYRIRFGDFAVMDGDRSLVALLKSFHFTKGKCLQVLKIDLSFWWFYILQLLSVALCYGDSILVALGVALPMSEEVAYVLFLALGSLAQGLLLWHYQANVSATYALAYEELRVES